MNSGVQKNCKRFNKNIRQVKAQKVFELNVFQNLKKSFQAFTCLMFLLNLLQLFWTPKFMGAQHLRQTFIHGWTEYFSSISVPEDTNIYVTFVLTRRKGGGAFSSFEHGQKFHTDCRSLMQQIEVLSPLCDKTSTSGNKLLFCTINFQVEVSIGQKFYPNTVSTCKDMIIVDTRYQKTK